MSPGAPVMSEPIAAAVAAGEAGEAALSAGGSTDGETAAASLPLPEAAGAMTLPEESSVGAAAGSVLVDGEGIAAIGPVGVSAFAGTVFALFDCDVDADVFGVPNPINSPH